MRGLTRSVIALIVPPLPAPSRPSNRMQTFRPLCTTHCWSLTNSTCSRASSRSYSLRFSLSSAVGSAFFSPGMRALPGEDEADVAGHTSRIFEHLGPKMKTERPEVLVPEFVGSLGAALQSPLPFRLRIVDPAAVIAAQGVGKPVDLDFTLSALGRTVDELRDELHQLLG